MSAIECGDVSETSPEPSDVSRRTWLAAERTWLAWWRTGIAVGAVAIAVGRFLPGLTHGVRWPFRVLGLGYGVLSIAILLVGRAASAGPAPPCGAVATRSSRPPWSTG